MNKEFPSLEERDHQREFLSDWWSEKKIFIGSRDSGKTTLMLCEARRFSECGFSILYISPSKAMSKHLQNQYKSLFDEMPTFDFGSYPALEKGNMLGRKKDVVILDEFQNITLETYNRYVVPLDPQFLRASACKAHMPSTHYLRDIENGGFFDSVYEY